MQRPRCVLVWLLLLLAVAQTSSSIDSNFRRVCYFSGEARLRSGAARYDVSNVDVTLCSHLVYAFADVTRDGRLAPGLGDSGDRNARYNAFNKLKLTAPTLKTLLAVGGWAAGSDVMASMAASRESRRVFVQDVLDIITEFGFDGLDLHWEFPTLRGGRAEDADNYVALLKDLSDAFNASSTAASAPLLLTLAVPAQPSAMKVFKVADLLAYVSWMHVLTFDLHGPWEEGVGFHSPLFPSRHDSPDNDKLNMASAANRWAELGVPRDRLVVGVASYGRSWRLVDPRSHGIGAPSSGPGEAGNLTRTPGFLAYYEICSLYKAGQAERYWEADHKAPYAVHHHSWTGYDDPKSLAIKVKWLRERDFGGVAFWTLEFDDFHGTCGQGSHALLRAVNYVLAPPTAAAEAPPSLDSHAAPVPLFPSIALAGLSISSKHRPEAISVPTGRVVTRSREDGYFRDEDDCQAFFQCHGGRCTHFRCPSTLRFDPRLSVCNWPNHVSDC